MLFLAWVTLSEHKWVISRERRGSDEAHASRSQRIHAKRDGIRTLGPHRAILPRDNSSALSKALKDRLVTRNVAKLAEPPTTRGGHSSTEPLTLEEARRFLAAVVGDRLQALYSVVLTLGLRRGEALGLEWSAIDLATGTLAVTQNVKRLKGKGLA